MPLYLRKETNIKSYKSQTNTKFTDALLSHEWKNISKSYDKFIKLKFKTIYNNLFKNKLCEINQNPDSKLSLYGSIKAINRYEPYFNSYGLRQYITKFRLSDHYLPIERGRLKKNKDMKEMKEFAHYAKYLWATSSMQYMIALIMISNNCP